MSNSEESSAQLIHSALCVGLHNLTTEEFDKLGRAWFEENLKRNPLPTEDDIWAANGFAFFAPCKCSVRCKCVGDICKDCCVGCAADDECTICNGQGRVIKEDCSICGGSGMYLILDSNEYKNLSSEEQQQLVSKLEAKEQNILSEYRIMSSDISEDFHGNERIDFLIDAITKLGGKVIPHPTRDWGNNFAVLLPKYPLNSEKGLKNEERK